MPEPTIDEMMRWVDIAYTQDDASADLRISEAIRAILEEHRDTPKNLENVLAGMLGREIQLEAIRAFVERVEKRFIARGSNVDFSAILLDELAAMEKEANAKTS